MPMRIPSAASVAEKWARVTPGRSQDYVTRASASGAAWQDGTNNAEANYNAAVQEAIGRGAYGQGTAGKAGAYTAGITDKGALRWGPGVAASRQKFEQRIARSLQALASVGLPPKLPRGNPGNLMRVAAVDEALHAAKMGR